MTVLDLAEDRTLVDVADFQEPRGLQDGDGLCPGVEVDLDGKGLPAGSGFLPAGVGELQVPAAVSPQARVRSAIKARAYRLVQRV